MLQIILMRRQEFSENQSNILIYIGRDLSGWRWGLWYQSRSIQRWVWIFTTFLVNINQLLWIIGKKEYWFQLDISYLKFNRANFSQIYTKVAIQNIDFTTFLTIKRIQVKLLKFGLLIHIIAQGTSKLPFWNSKH